MGLPSVPVQPFKFEDRNNVGKCSYDKNGLAIFTNTCLKIADGILLCHIHQLNAISEFGGVGGAIAFQTPTFLPEQ